MQTLTRRNVFDTRNWKLDFLGHQPGLEIGFLGSGVEAAYAEVANVFSDQPLCILDARHHSHNGLLLLGRHHAGTQRHQVDAVISEKHPHSLASFYADCGALVLESQHFICLAHAGRHELTAQPTLIHEVVGSWPEDSAIHAWIGPILSGRYYQYPHPTPEQERYGVKTIWPGIRGLELKQMLVDQLLANGIEPGDIFDCGIDPFAMRLEGREEWASDQYCRRYLYPPQQTHRDLGLLQVY